jgi:predicted O-methyltransferase YrrM
MPPDVTWISEKDFTIGDVRFNCNYMVGEPPPGFQRLTKTPEMVQPYVDLVAELRPRRILELGIRFGGSAAFLHQLARPERLVVLDIVPTPAPLLAAYVDEHGAGDVVRPHYGVDQSDRARLRAIVDEAFGDEPLDLVIDDASHLYEPSVASFEELFPRLRPGGRYIIEDWASDFDHLNHWAEQFAKLAPEQQQRLRQMRRDGEVDPPEPLLSLLAIELVMMRASRTDVIADVGVSRHWTVVTRGPGALQPGDFRLRDSYFDLMGLLDPMLPR